jgi:hypothetical protein
MSNIKNFTNLTKNLLLLMFSEFLWILIFLNQLIKSIVWSFHSYFQIIKISFIIFILTIPDIEFLILFSNSNLLILITRKNFRIKFFIIKYQLLMKKFSIWGKIPLFSGFFLWILALKISEIYLSCLY